MIHMSVMQSSQIVWEIPCENLQSQRTEPSTDPGQDHNASQICKDLLVRDMLRRDGFFWGQKMIRGLQCRAAGGSCTREREIVSVHYSTSISSSHFPSPFLVLLKNCNTYNYMITLVTSNTKRDRISALFNFHLLLWLSISFCFVSFSWVVTHAITWSHWFHKDKQWHQREIVSSILLSFLKG